MTLFALAIFTGSTLVFLIQPMITRMMLPSFGGAASVWNTALVFFQLVLLVGYGWAHLSVRWLGMRWQPRAQLLVLALPLAFLPIALPGNVNDPGGAGPVLWVLYVLAASVGLPYAVVSTASPLLQRWFAQVNHPAAHDPYFLYATGNVGSLLALLAYPNLVEANMTLHGQALLWSWGYAAFALLVVACALVVRLRPAPMVTHRAADVPGGAVSQGGDAAANAALLDSWQVVALAAVPSALMVAVTTFATADIASIPFLWVVPLAVYLLTFVIAFASVGYLGPRSASVVLLAVVVALVAMAVAPYTWPLWLKLSLPLLLLFAGSLTAHGRLASARPAPSELTGFYLLISVGGVVGGGAAALLAPIVFNDVWEYPLAIGGCLLVRQLIGSRPRLRSRSTMLWIAGGAGAGSLTHWLVERGHAGSWSTVQWSAVFVLALALCAATIRRPAAFAVAVVLVLQPAPLVGDYTLLVQDRSFFGLLRVTNHRDPDEHMLFNGTTLHGTERFDGNMRGEPVAYYERGGPVGDVFDVLQRTQPFDRVGVIGLGAGGMAAYSEHGQRFVFYDIDQAVIDVARNPRYFSYIDEARGDITIIHKDGRLGLQDDAPGSYDLILVDAFSSDSIPVHLLTVEALRTYLEHLAPGGAVAFHISSRYLDLQPVLLANANVLGAKIVVRPDDTLTEARVKRSARISLWMVISKSSVPGDALLTAHPRDWQVPFEIPGYGHAARPWTDDYSNVLSTVNWGGLPYRTAG